MELAAVFEGRVVRYPAKAAFVIERRRPHKRYEVVASRDTILQALRKFKALSTDGVTIKLSAAYEGRLKQIARS